MRRFVSVDLETTGVSPDKDYIVEVGLAGESPVGTYFEEQFSLDFPKEAMTKGAAAVNGWGKRQFAPIVTHNYAIDRLSELLFDAHIVGKNPAFDESFLRRYFYNYHTWEVGESHPWHHRMVDVGTLAWGSYAAACQFRNLGAYLQPPDVAMVEEMVGIKRETVDGYHTALLDARWNYRVFRDIIPLPKED